MYEVSVNDRMCRRCGFRGPLADGPVRMDGSHTGRQLLASGTVTGLRRRGSRASQA